MSSEPRAGPESQELRRRLQAALGERYVLADEVGSGGTGTVFAALDAKHDRRVAVKVLRPESTAGVDSERFLREIRIAARLNHPHVVPLHDSGEADGLLYYVMPLMEGESLRSLLEREGALPVARALAIARDVAEGLGHAHALGIVHRDVKPANILLAGGHALLADFGVARAVEAAAEGPTATGFAVGTPAYMSPEQAAGAGEVDARSDLYSLACVLFETIAGRRPFPGTSAVSVLAGHIQGSAPLLSEVRPEVSAELSAAVQQALAKDPADRFQDAASFAEALAGGAPPTRSWWMPAAVGGGLVAVLAVAVILALPRLRGSPDLSDQRGSVVVLPFRDAIQTPEGEALLVDLADELTRQLNRWDSVRAVPQVSLAGVGFDLGVKGPVLDAAQLEDGLHMARALGVETLISLTLRVRGDSAEVSATRFDPRNGSQVGRVLESRGSTDDPFRLAAGIAHGLLGLTGPVEAVENLRRQSGNAEALRRYEEGLDLLERWHLAEAETAFRRATEMDSAFAMAHHYLAVDLYWQAAREPRGLVGLGPEAARLSRAALRHSGGLPTRERDHVVAFNRFMEGDYQGAREGYASLIARDSTDVYAWLLRGIVEFRDPWLVEQPDGSLRPRSDLSLAARAFTETTRLSPGFHLGYGHLFDITEEILRASGGLGVGLERPRSEWVPPWEMLVDPNTQMAFYPAYLDSLVWLSQAEFEALPSSALTDGAMRLLEASMRTLRRWAAYAPQEARPHTELAVWTVRQRALLKAPQPPERLDSLARLAREQAERALSLSADTLAGDLVRLGNLRMANGDPAGARELVDMAMGWGSGGGGEASPLPPAVANVLLHGGDWRTALALLERVGTRRRFFRDPDTGELMGEGGAETVVPRLSILGACGVDGPPLDRAFADLEARWAAPPPGTAPIGFLRRREAFWIAPALAAAPEVLARWRAEGDLEDPLWAAVDPATDDRLSAIHAALGVGDPEVTDPARSYLLGTAALDAGDPGLALRLLSRLDSIPLGLEELRDPGWGLLALSLFRRGEASEAAGDVAGARGSYEMFLATRAPGDGAAPFEAAARGRLARLPEGG